jgi:hypothetical protein
MTDKEAEYWDDYYTKNTIMPDPDRPGVLALTGRILGDMDSDVAEYVRVQAAATGKTQGQDAALRADKGGQQAIEKGVIRAADHHRQRQFFPLVLLQSYK